MTRLHHMDTLVAGLFFLMWAPALPSADFVVLETGGDGRTEVVDGSEPLADRPVTPASTFKIVIAWAALERGLAGPETRHECRDAHVPGVPRDLTMREAMYFSSNDYLTWLAEQMGVTRLTESLQRSFFLEAPPPGDWLAGGMETVHAGGNLKVDARQQHRFIRRVMEGQLASSPRLQEQLLKCLTWPSPNASIALYGKTGSSHRVAWFNGFGGTKSDRKAVTVLIVGDKASRNRAIGLFYGRFALKPPREFVSDGEITPVAVPRGRPFR